jgi:hypothetical protein
MKLIPLTQGQSAMVDDEDFEKLNNFNWHAQITTGTTDKFYAIRNLLNHEEGYIKDKRIKVKMHRVILNIKDPNIFVDHKDRNTLNNQKHNIRTCTQSQNLRNVSPRGVSKYMGVHPYRKKWRASIRVKKGEVVQLGVYNYEEEAARAYDAAILKHDPEFGHINFK